jgi:predicted enzyme related to lactoylglutathione lyase
MELTGVLVSTSPDRFPQMRDFYVETIGLTPRSDRPGFVNFDFGHSRLTIALHEAVDGPATDPLRVMINLRTDDIVQAIRRCDPRSVMRRPEREKWGGMVATIADPDGNVLQFLQME